MVLYSDLCQIQIYISKVVFICWPIINDPNFKLFLLVLSQCHSIRPYHMIPSGSCLSNSVWFWSLFSKLKWSFLMKLSLLISLLLYHLPFSSPLCVNTGLCPTTWGYSPSWPSLPPSLRLLLSVLLLSSPRLQCWERCSELRHLWRSDPLLHWQT